MFHVNLRSIKIKIKVYLSIFLNKLFSCFKMICTQELRQLKTIVPFEQILPDAKTIVNNYFYIYKELYFLSKN